MSNTQCCGEIWTAERSGGPGPAAWLVVVALMASLLNSLCSLLASSLRYSMFLASLTSGGLQCTVNFILAVLCTALSGPVSWLLGLPLKSGWNLAWLYNSSIVHAYKTSTACMMPSSPAISSSNLYYWIMATEASKHMDGWSLSTKSWGTYFLGGPFSVSPQGKLWSLQSLLKANSFTLSLQKVKSCWFPECP